MVLAIGSMAVKAVFNGGGLLSGLAKTSGKLKEVSQRSKSTTTEMKRMRSGVHKLRNALAAIGVGGFTALMMSAPQLAGSLAKIKYEMQQLAWSVGKHLKPALDSVATILQGIRTGDWETVKRGVKELADSLLTLVDKAITVTVDTIFGEGTTGGLKKDFDNWWTKVQKAYDEGDMGSLIIAFTLEPTKWVYDRANEYMSSLAEDIKTSEGRKKLMDSLSLNLMIAFPGVGAFIKGATIAGAGGIGFGKRMLGIDQPKTDSSGFGGSYQVGGYVPKTGLYNLHAGETVTMKGSSGTSNTGSANITVDFSNANINLASGIEIDQFADIISRKIADKQNTLTY